MTQLSAFTGFHAKMPESQHWRDGCSFGVCMKEHRKEVELHEGTKYTRIIRKQSQSEQNKCAITDHVNIENHIIDWKEATIIGRESDRTTR